LLPAAATTEAELSVLDKWNVVKASAKRYYYGRQ